MDLSFKRENLPGAGRTPELPSRSFDVHYAWAAATAFHAFGGAPKNFLVAFEMRLTGTKEEAAIREQCLDVFVSPDAELHPVWWNAQFVYGTAMVNAQGLTRLEDAAAANRLERFEVALATPPARAFTALGPAWGALGAPGAPAKCQQPIMVGVVDHGCPLASPRLQVSGRSRVLNLWDQEGSFSIAGSGTPAGWGFGSSADHLAIDVHFSGVSAADDWTAYRDAGLRGVTGAASHGAHVLGCVFGAQQCSTLLWDGVHGSAPRVAVPVLPQHPDLVFVQLPNDYLQGVSRSVLAPYRLAGLRYILECAGPQTSEIVVPVASENYDGSHDGESLYDRASDALVQYASSLGKTYNLFVSAGNGLRSNTHERVALSTAKPDHAFTVRVLPANERNTFVEIWAPHTLDGLEFGLQSPGIAAPPLFHSGDGAWVHYGPDGKPLCGYVSLRQPSTFGGFQRCVLFVLPPTLVWKGCAGPVGDWKIFFRAVAGAQGDVCGYIARSTPFAGGQLRGGQSTFPRRFSRDWDFGSNRPAGEARPYDEYSLSGLATANNMTVVAGYQARGGKRSLYSAGGPARFPARLAGRFVVDVAAPSDGSRMLPGLLGWGNRFAGYVRFAGTSVAAPLAAGVYYRRRGLPVKGGPTAREEQQVPIPVILT